MCVPYLGIYLSDLLFTEDGNKDYVEHRVTGGSTKRFINFTKFRRFAFWSYFGLYNTFVAIFRTSKILDEIRSYQTSDFPKPGSSVTHTALFDLIQARNFLNSFEPLDEVCALK